MKDWEEAALKRVDKVLNIVLTIVICFGLGYCVGRKSVNNTLPIEESVNIDSLIKVNDSIKITVDKLDSIKDAKIIEVQTLDNDSTIKLFYELISK